MATAQHEMKHQCKMTGASWCKPRRPRQKMQSYMLSSLMQDLWPLIVGHGVTALQHMHAPTLQEPEEQSNHHVNMYQHDPPERALCRQSCHDGLLLGLRPRRRRWNARRTLVQSVRARRANGVPRRQGQARPGRRYRTFKPGPPRLRRQLPVPRASWEDRPVGNLASRALPSYVHRR